MSKKIMLVGLGVWLVFMSASAYAFWPFTVRSDMVGYCAPCWGENNKIYFIKKVTFGRAISGKTALHAILFMGGSYFADHTEVYLCSMNYDSTDKKEIVKIGDTDDDTYWLPMYLDYCQVKNLLLLSGGSIPSGGTSHGIWTIKTDGTGLKRILDAGMHASSSPDGKRIVYEVVEQKEKRNKDGWLEGYEFSNTIWVMNADGSNKKMISTTKIPEKQRDGTVVYKFDDTNPIWSPKGDLIAFVCKGWIWVMKPDGNERRRVIRGHLTDWSSDGNMLLGSVPGGSAIFDLEGNVVKRLKYCGEWSPDGKTILGYLGTYDIESGIEKSLLADVRKKDEKEHFVYKRPNNIW
ncbi:MAG: hypothetical protein AB1414_13435 [bacterium]